MPSAGKHATGAKRSRANVQQVQNAGKPMQRVSSTVKNGEKRQPVKNAGKQSLRKEVTFDLGFFHKFRVKIASINFQSSKNCFNTETANYQST